ncbi:acyltransferase family protein [Tsuneonella sp. YG55]|uniref:Acyltransferase family protein n=1 Tax=Tsuneonella litorea TaxID=2976475 RepID=A0A9X3ALG3_9SPHN|nr:acyltransferase family protein [Tsuneonella litorea]MCT2559263.1 acyltransferase family protein [Tsuneonella litorea]
MDWLRIGAFALLILYHIGMFFVPWGWHVKTAEPLQWATVPMLATNSWRIPLLFVVSGYASAALFAKSRAPGAFVRNRSARLLVPLVAGMALFVPPQPWVELTFRHGYAADFGWFWFHDYFRFGKLDGIQLPTWNHLWFVAYLWLYTIGLVLILLLPRGVRERGRRGFDSLLGGGRVLWVPLALLVVRLWLGWPAPEDTHDVVGDLYAHTLQLPLFLFGFLLRDAPAVWRGVQRWWRLAGALAIAAYGLVVWVEFTWPGDTPAPAWAYPAFGAARTVQMWCAIVALIGVADRFWNHDHPRRAMLTEAVFPFYIIHQTIIVVLGWYLLRFALPAGAELLVLLAATVAGCWLFYLVGREIAPLRPLIGLRSKAPVRRA